MQTGDGMPPAFTALIREKGHPNFESWLESLQLKDVRICSLHAIGEIYLYRIKPGGRDGDLSCLRRPSSLPNHFPFSSLPLLPPSLRLQFDLESLVCFLTCAQHFSEAEQAAAVKALGRFFQHPDDFEGLHPSLLEDNVHAASGFSLIPQAVKLGGMGR
jgi:hypothetical protein